MLRAWVIAGLDPQQWSGCSLREADIILQGAHLRNAQAAWQVAQFTRYSFHAPNKMPECPEMPRPKGVNRQADVVAVKAWMRSKARKV